MCDSGHAGTWNVPCFYVPSWPDDPQIIKLKNSLKERLCELNSPTFTLGGGCNIISCPLYHLCLIEAVKGSAAHG
jgi:hypothetical protein